MSRFPFQRSVEPKISAYQSPYDKVLQSRIESYEERKFASTYVETEDERRRKRYAIVGSWDRLLFETERLEGGAEMNGDDDAMVGTPARGFAISPFSTRKRTDVQQSSASPGSTRKSMEKSVMSVRTPSSSSKKSPIKRSDTSASVFSTTGLLSSHPESTTLADVVLSFLPLQSAVSGIGSTSKRWHRAVSNSTDLWDAVQISGAHLDRESVEGLGSWKDTTRRLTHSLTFSGYSPLLTSSLLCTSFVSSEPFCSLRRIELRHQIYASRASEPMSSQFGWKWSWLAICGAIGRTCLHLEEFVIDLSGYYCKPLFQSSEADEKPTEMKVSERTISNVGRGNASTREGERERERGSGYGGGSQHIQPVTEATIGLQRPERWSSALSTLATAKGGKTPGGVLGQTALAAIVSSVNRSFGSGVDVYEATSGNIERDNNVNSVGDTEGARPTDIRARKSAVDGESAASKWQFPDTGDAESPADPTPLGRSRSLSNHQIIAHTHYEAERRYYIEQYFPQDAWTVLLRGCRAVVAVEVYGIRFRDWITESLIAFARDAMNIRRVTLCLNDAAEEWEVSPQVAAASAPATGESDDPTARVDVSSAVSLFCNGCPLLSHFYLWSDYRSPTAFLNPLSQCHSLTHLSLSQCIGVDDTTLRSVLVEVQSTLQLLDLDGCISLTDTALAGLSALPQLKSLRLSGCLHIGDPGVWCVLAATPVNTLQHVSLAGIEALSDPTVATLVSRHPETLEVLNLSHCTSISDSAFEPLEELTLPALTHVNVSYCPYIGDTAIRNITRSSRNIQELILTHCWGITDDSMVEISAHCESISAIDVSDCRGLTSTGVFYTFHGSSTTAWKHLRHFAFRQIRSAPLADALESALRSTERPGHLRPGERLSGYISPLFSELRTLDLSEAWALSDSDVSLLLRRCRCLEDLSLNGCRSLTDDAFIVVENRMENLLGLELSQCWHLTRSTFSWLSLHTPNLRYIDCSGCHCVDEESLSALLISCRELALVRARGCWKVDVQRLRDTPGVNIADVERVVEI